MPEPSFTAIGPYRVVREVGRGGMGVVYLARDERLGRDVAIKALPVELASDPGRLERFEREAKALASLNHPGIASIYGLEEAEGKRYLILEYVPGETLDEVLRRGPMPLSEALPLARQIAEAVECAHANGIIHRDLKPANIKFAGPDQIKVLDFGLAKAIDERMPSASEIMASPTYVPTHTPTMPGVVLGTAGYLSPEQARGRDVDKRADIFSFGCVLFEMLVGATVFPGETVTDSLGATLHKEPDWDRLPADTPPTIRLLLRRCLRKDRKQRLHDIADARVELEEAINDPTSSSLSLAGAALAVADRRGTPPWALAIGLVGIAAGGLGVWRPWERPPTQPEPVFLSLTAPEGYAFDQYDISPDGTTVAFCGSAIDRSSGNDREKPPIHVRRLDQPTATELRGTEGGHGPVFSPDGRWLAFERESSLLRTRVDGGPPVEVTRLQPSQSWARAWLDDGTLVVQDNPGGLLALDVNSGSMRPLPQKQASEGFVFDTRITPARDSDLLFVNRVRFGEAGLLQHLRVIATASGESREIVEGAAWSAYPAPNRLLFSRDGALYGTRFDADRLECVGDIAPLLSGVGIFDCSESGTLVYGGRSMPWDDLGDIVQISAETGESTVLSERQRAYASPAVSPDGAAVLAEVMTVDGGVPRIWLIDTKSGVEQPVTPADRAGLAAVWSPDGASIAYATPGTTDSSIVVMRVDGSADPRVIVESSGDARWIVPISWPAEGGVLLAGRYPAAGGNSDIVLVRLADGEIVPLLETDAGEDPWGLSPDGTLLAYGVRNDGDEQQFVQRIDLETGHLGERKRLPATRELSRFRWSPVGNTLLAQDQDGDIWSMSVLTEPELAISQPELLYDLERSEIQDWTPTADGIIAVRKESASTDLTELKVVLNFNTLLDRALPDQ